MLQIQEAETSGVEAINLEAPMNKPIKTSKPKLPKATKSNRDPICKTVKRINDLDSINAVIDGAGKALENQVCRIYFESEAENNRDLIDQLLDQIATLEASSVEGAIIQLITAGEVFIRKTEMCEPIDKIRFMRLLFSAVNLFAKKFPDQFPDEFHVNHMNTHLDPWKDSVQRLGVVETRGITVGGYTPGK